MNEIKRKISDEELEWLASSYLKLKVSKIYRTMTKTFQQYVEEFLERELLEIKRIKEA